MKTVVLLVVLLAIGFLAVIPITKHLITKNQVERELETALVEYQTLSRERFQRRVEKIAIDNSLSSGLKIQIVDTQPTGVAVTIRYTSSYEVFFVARNEEIVISKATTSLGM